jgi:tol-pal system protein YbgF
MIRSTLLVSVLSLALMAPASAQLFGPSDEEKAREAGQDNAIKTLQDQTRVLPQQDARLRALEDKVRGLTDSLANATGTNEELQHQLQIQNDKIDRMQKDFAYRLCTLSAQQLNAGDQINCAASTAGGGSGGGMPAGNMGGQAYVPPPGTNMLPPPPPASAPAGNGNQVVSEFDNPGSGQRGRPPGNLGTLPAGNGRASLNGSLAGNGNQYQAAMQLLEKAQYAEASAQFRAFADANPQDTDLAPQAIFWVANIAFIQQDYSTASRNFAEVIKKYPKSTRAPDAMLKLAQSSISMGQKSDGCTILGLIKTKYPDAASQTLNQAAALRKTACAKER